MYYLITKGLGEFFYALKSELNVSSVRRNVAGAKQIVPQTEGDAKVDPAKAIARQRIGVMPDVHYGVVKDILQWPVAPVEVGMIEVANGDGRVKYDVCLLWRKTTNKHDGNVLHGGVKDIFHPVVTQVSRKAHLFYRMMHFVKIPEEFESVQHAVSEPLHKICSHKKDNQLECPVHLAQVKQGQATYVSSD